MKIFRPILVVATFGLTALAPLFAQTHKVAAPQKVTRAIGVYEWTGALAKPDAARLVPVSVYLDGHMQDAGIYLARPVPFALQTGNVYSVERAGEHLGTLNLDYARNVVSRSSAGEDAAISAWFGYGRFLLPAAEPKPPKLKPSANVPVIVGSISGTDDDKPHYTVRQAAADTAPAGNDKSAAPAASPAPDDDPDRPTLRHRDPKDEATKDKKRRKESDSGVIGPKTSLNDDPDRPTMRRGVPAGSVAVAQLAGMPPNLHQAVAVSDAGSHETQIFTREWENSRERAETLAAMQLLARPRVTNYLTTNNLKPAAAKAAVPAFASQPAAVNHTTTRSRRSTPTQVVPPAVALGSEQLLGYTLSYGGLPTFVYTAETPVADGGPVYVTLVAQRLPSGEIQISFSSLTDATHLNRVPWYRPVDAVDPDGGHRASLLFELRAQTSRQFALYRLITAQAEQTFATGVIE